MMNEFQVPLIQALVFAFVISAILNYLIYIYSKNINLKRNEKEKRLSTKLIPPFGGIAC